MSHANRLFHTVSELDYSLRVAVPTPRGKTGGRERLRKTDTNRQQCDEPKVTSVLNIQKLGICLTFSRVSV